MPVLRVTYEGLNGVSQIHVIHDYDDMWESDLYEGVYQSVRYNPYFDLNHGQNIRLDIVEQMLTIAPLRGKPAKALYYGSKKMGDFLKLCFKPFKGDIWMATDFGCVSSSFYKK